MQHFDYKPHGVCPMSISFDLDGDTVHNVSLQGRLQRQSAGNQPRGRGHDRGAD